jgi:hypothetical protein
MPLLSVPDPPPDEKAVMLRGRRVAARTRDLIEGVLVAAKRSNK